MRSGSLEKLEFKEVLCLTHVSNYPGLIISEVSDFNKGCHEYGDAED